MAGELRFQLFESRAQGEYFLRMVKAKCVTDAADHGGGWQFLAVGCSHALDLQDAFAAEDVDRAGRWVAVDDSAGDAALVVSADVRKPGPQDVKRSSLQMGKSRWGRRRERANQAEDGVVWPPPIDLAVGRCSGAS